MFGLDTLLETGLKAFQAYFPPDMKPEDKARMELGLANVKKDLTNSMNEYSKAIIKEQSSIIQAEANGESFLQRNWRPITMLTFLALVVCDSFGLLAFRLADDAWTLLQLGIGGYIVGRSAQGVASSVTSALKKKDEV